MSLGGGKRPVSKEPTHAMGLDIQQAEYGRCVPVLFGRNKLPGTVVWYGDFQAIRHVESNNQRGGKGGGGKSPGTVSYTYRASFMTGLQEGTGNIVNVYNGATKQTLAAAGGVQFSGALGQATWAHLSGTQAIGYSGTLVAAFQNLDLGDSASLPNFSFETDGRNQFNNAGGVYDANPADIATTICTDPQVGINFQALGDLTAWSNYCKASGLLISPVYSTQQASLNTLSDLFKYTNTAAWFSEGKLKCVPYGDTTITGNGATFTPNLTSVADLGPNDFITNGPGPAVRVKRKSPADAMNTVRIEYKDRSQAYRTSSAIASIDQDVVATGVRADSSETCDFITSAPVARLVAQNQVQRDFYVRNTYEFQLSWRYCWLEPMDVVTLTDSGSGLSSSPARITEVSEDEHGLLSVIAEELPAGVGHGGIYNPEVNAAVGVDPNADPGPVTAPYFFRAPGFLVSAGAPEIWCAISATGSRWAGCDVYISSDNSTYSFLKTFARKSAYGQVTNALSNVADPDTTSTANVVLNGGVQLLGTTAADCDELVTLAMVDTELIAYQTATLAAGPSYNLGTRIRRGAYGTAIASHAANAPFVRLDENILRIPIDPSKIGQTIYVKFLSFNDMGNGGRTLAGETAYSYVIGTNVEFPDVAPVPASFAVTAVADGVNLSWTNTNPAAVECTSIEYATSGTGPWTVLGQCGPTQTSFTHQFTNGATYYYRIRARGFNIAAGWSAYTSTLSSAGKTVANGATVGATLGPGGNVTGAVDANDRAIIDFSQGGHFNKNVDWMADGTTYGRPLLGRLSSGKPWIDFGEGIHANKNLDNLADGSIYRRTNSTFVDSSGQVTNTFMPDTRNDNQLPSWYRTNYPNRSVSEFKNASAIGLPSSSSSWVTCKTRVPWADSTGGQVIQEVSSGTYSWYRAGAANDASWGAWRDYSALTQAGSGQRIGDQRNLPARNIMNYPTNINPSLSYSASAGTPATATISMAALTVVAGSVSISYNAASVGVTGTGGTAVTYYVYFDDPNYAGGTPTLVATTSSANIYTADGRAYCGSISVTFPTSGSGSGGGGGGGTCPWIEAWVYERERGFMRAGNVVAGMWLLMNTGKFGKVTHSKRARVPGVRIGTETGRTLTCSETAPILTSDGYINAPDLQWRTVKVSGADRLITDIDSLDEIDVQHISLAEEPDPCFMVGDDPDHLFPHHNLKP
ncbi:MAG: hypothetical protein JSR70_09475 [Proteobacteria bacterium]|nr:hypothetical protein [Pseudomonadota bacterium]